MLLLSDLLFDYLERNQFDVSESRNTYNFDKLFLERADLITPVRCTVLYASTLIIFHSQNTR